MMLYFNDSNPESFKLDAVSENRQYKAIGNAVPPVLMWHIAKGLTNIDLLKEKKTIEQEVENVTPIRQIIATANINEEIQVRQ